MIWNKKTKIYKQNKKIQKFNKYKTIFLMNKLINKIKCIIIKFKIMNKL